MAKHTPTNSVEFKGCELYFSSLMDKVRAYPVIGQKMQEFRAFKAANPMANYGSSDKPFLAKQIYGTNIPGIKHAHLTLDIMVVYTLSGANPRTFRLYGIFSHDELGIGQPLNIRKQEPMVKRFKRQEFNQ